MIKKYEEVFTIFDKLDDHEVLPPMDDFEAGAHCYTSFKYKLDQVGFGVAETGLKDFLNTVSLVLAFNKSIE